jgi:Zn-finger protein
MKRQCECKFCPKRHCEQTATLKVMFGATGPFYFCADCARMAKPSTVEKLLEEA